jgi:hypothetical protein
MKWGKWTCWIFACLCFLFGCKKKPPVNGGNKPPVVKLDRPDFSADSAYSFIQAQVDFGPRVPGSDAHRQCAGWLENKLGQYGAEVTVQTGSVKRYDGADLPMYNIIGSFNRDNPVRILLCAHWDTRHIADKDVLDRDRPIPGANDGGSGVGVLLEVARQLQLRSPDAGVDIIFFDVEDQGQPDGLSFKPDTYCLGSQFWARNPHVPNYKAKAGILLDMVGAKGAVFTLEGTSMNYAAQWMRTVWDNAIQLGHSNHFSYERTDAITDDHLYINRIRRIPTIDIIQYDYSTSTGFGSYWHTHEDDMDVIDRGTLQAVGETVLATVYTFK